MCVCVFVCYLGQWGGGHSSEVRASITGNMVHVSHIMSAQGMCKKGVHKGSERAGGWWTCRLSNQWPVSIVEKDSKEGSNMVGHVLESLTG